MNRRTDCQTLQYYYVNLWNFSLRTHNKLDNYFFFFFWKNTNAVGFTRGIANDEDKRWLQPTQLATTMSTQSTESRNLTNIIFTIQDRTVSLFTTKITASKSLNNRSTIHSSSKSVRGLTFRHRASCILGQAFHYSPQNAFYIFNQQIYFIVWYLLDRASLI